MTKTIIKAIRDWYYSDWVKKNPDVDLNGGSARVKPEAIRRKIKELKERQRTLLTQEDEMKREDLLRMGFRKMEAYNGELDSDIRDELILKIAEKLNIEVYYKTSEGGYVSTRYELVDDNI